MTKLDPFSNHSKKDVQGQIGRVEGPEFTSSLENTKITTNCWTTINKKTGTYQKIILLPKKRKPEWDSWRTKSVIQSNPIPTRLVTHKLENNYTTEVLPQEWEFWAPRQAPHSKGLASRGDTEHLSLKASRAWSQELHRTGGNRDSTSGGHTQGTVHTRTQRKK